MIIILILSAKMTNLSLFKIKLFWIKDDDVIISSRDVTNKILSHDSYYILDVLMWPKLSSLQFYNDLARKTTFFETWSWFKFNNLGLLVMALKFHTSVAKGLKLKVRKFWRLIPTVVEVCPPPPCLGLINVLISSFIEWGVLSSDKIILLGIKLWKTSSNIFLKISTCSCTFLPENKYDQSKISK